MRERTTLIKGNNTRNILVARTWISKGKLSNSNMIFILKHNSPPRSITSNDVPRVSVDEIKKLEAWLKIVYCELLSFGGLDFRSVECAHPQYTQGTCETLLQGVNFLDVSDIHQNNSHTSVSDSLMRNFFDAISA